MPEDLRAAVSRLSFGILDVLDDPEAAMDLLMFQEMAADTALMLQERGWSAPDTLAIMTGLVQAGFKVEGR